MHFQPQPLPRSTEPSPDRGPASRRNIYRKIWWRHYTAKWVPWVRIWLHFRSCFQSHQHLWWRVLWKGTDHWAGAWRGIRILKAGLVIDGAWFKVSADRKWMIVGSLGSHMKWNFLFWRPQSPGGSPFRREILRYKIEEMSPQSIGVKKLLVWCCDTCQQRGFYWFKNKVICGERESRIIANLRRWQKTCHV